MTTLIDPIDTIDEYLDRSDWRVNANANAKYSVGSMIMNSAGKVIANYWLDKVYPAEIGELHRDGAVHIHDLDMLGGYCCGHSLRRLIEEGFNGIEGAVAAKPPKHMSAACGQIVNFLGTLQNEWAGAQAFSSFDTYLAPFVRNDNMSLDEVKQCIQEMVFSLNVSSRWGQCPFTNLTFDWTVPDDLIDQSPVIGGEEMDYTYGDLKTEMDIINQAFIEVMSTGDADGRPFTFPIPTYNITKDFDWDSDNSKRLFEMTAKYGLPYFQNFINSDLDPHMIRSMCCRLQLDLSELLKRGNGLFGSAELTGSIGVVTLNMARLGFTHKGDRAGLLRELDYLLTKAKESLELKRGVISELMEHGLYPYSKRYVGNYDNFFSTIGVNGMNEMIRNFTDDALDITDAEGKEFALDVLDVIRERLAMFQEETGHMYNLEATPAEGTTYRFAKEDQRKFHGDIIQAGTRSAPYYTNSSQLPVGFTDDPFLALDEQEDLQAKYTGGTVLHLYMGQAMPDSVTCAKLVHRALENFREPYITITPTFSICPAHGYISGDFHQCPTCGSETEVWTRVMGYFRPYKSFNIGKKSEFRERTYFGAPKDE